MLILGVTSTPYFQSFLNIFDRVDWMLEECRKAGPTAAGNYKDPTYPDCLKWVVQSWAKLDTAGVRKAAK